jgi:hypothetical protein
MPCAASTVLEIAGYLLMTTLPRAQLHAAHDIGRLCFLAGSVGVATAIGLWLFWH